MDFVKLSKSTHQSFARSLYTSSFPPEERREFSQIPDLHLYKPFTFYVIEQSQQPFAIMALWTFASFSYIEHLAVANEQRNRGIGTKIISNLKSQRPNPLVLEVELPLTETALRRIKFYERLGFILLNDNYLQPPYSINKQAVEMRLMVSDPNLLNICDTKSIIQILHTQVYNIQI
ncbi:MAG: GNAT family N-acetyltransferase [Bacteroidales bacterium]|jgi:ribosomal protein S18 acetylase RimI-like enzyme|nr:GNAT family N-acetyltransferase [Bacteroidales bacterium]